MQNNFVLRSSFGLIAFVMLSQLVLAQDISGENQVLKVLQNKSTSPQNNKILEALTTKPHRKNKLQGEIRTRGVFLDQTPVVKPPSAAQNKVLDKVVNRGFTINEISKTPKKHVVRTTSAERKEIQGMVKGNNLLSIDLEIGFEYNSARLHSKSRGLLNELGQALLDKRLKNTRILLSGYTDAKGSNAYNLSLSEQRADAVKLYLIKQFGIKAKRLISVGFGEENLKQPSAPFSGKNRRVQIVNLAG